MPWVGCLRLLEVLAEFGGVESEPHSGFCGPAGIGAVGQSMRGCLGEGRIEADEEIGAENPCPLFGAPDGAFGAGEPEGRPDGPLAVMVVQCQPETMRDALSGLWLTASDMSSQFSSRPTTNRPSVTRASEPM